MSDTTITRLLAWESLDSRGNPTVGCTMELEGGGRGTVHVPSGASTGQYEAIELRDGDARFGGRGTRRAVAAVNDELASATVGMDAADQAALDAALAAVDGSASFERLGGNAVLAVSLAASVATADQRRAPLYESLGDGGAPLLPMPMVNIVSGGAHAQALVGIQDVLVIPVGATTFAEAIDVVARVRDAARGVLERLGHSTALVADEGGFAAALGSNREAVAIVAEAIDAVGADAAIAIDVAANQLRDGDAYRFDGRVMDGVELAGTVAAWLADLPIVSVEDVCADDDEAGWIAARAELAGRAQLVADDLAATNEGRVRRIAELGLADALLVKPNQVGTVTGARTAFDLARALGYNTIVSARSGDTEDSWLADLAVGWRAGQIKVGSLSRSERTSKWNRLLEIEAERPDATLARFAVP